jgi:hypothetical protein
MPTEEGDKRTGRSASDVLSEEKRIAEYQELKKLLDTNTAAYLLALDDAKKAYDNSPDKPTDEQLKNPEVLNRRGLEAAFDYERRRNLGYPPKNEKDDPTSRHSLQAIEETLMLDNANNGVEFAASYDKNGELIAINKGEKANVATYSTHSSQLEGGTVTHSHPTDNNDRLLGHSFSKGDIEFFGTFDLAEMRAVAREGTYSIKGRATLPQGLLENMKKSTDKDTRRLAEIYEKTSSASERHSIACSVMAKEARAISEHLQMYGDRSSDYKAGGDWFNSPKYGTMLAIGHARICQRYGVQYEFKAREGFEAMEKAIKTSMPTSQDGYYALPPSARRADLTMVAGGVVRMAGIPDTVNQPMPNPSTTLPRGYTRDGDHIPVQKAKPTPAPSPAPTTSGGSPQTVTGGDGKRKRVPKPKVETPPPAPKPIKPTDIKPRAKPPVTIKDKPSVTVVGGKPFVVPVIDFGGGSGNNSGFSSGGGSFVTGGGFNFTR